MSRQYKILYWAPRIICVLAILFVSLFALDAFDPELTIWQQIAGFLIHLIPSFVLIGLLIIAWKYEKIGGILLILVGIIFSFIIFRMNFRMNHSIWKSLIVIVSLTFPFILSGALFLAHYRKERRH